MEGKCSTEERQIRKKTLGPRFWLFPTIVIFLCFSVLLLLLSSIPEPLDKYWFFSPAPGGRHSQAPPPTPQPYFISFSPSPSLQTSISSSSRFNDSRPVIKARQLIMAAKILANLIVMGSGILARAFVQAYRQALTNASKSGVAQETIQHTVSRASKVMTEQEARQILGVTEEMPWEEVVKKYDTLFERNAQTGSFYLQSKVQRAKERLETLYQSKGQDAPS
ncbi:unnamed protein product [Citrullus colocynthis]|uniref:Uncharacterized protein n=1 Tax=Citrullus colocynthis TaxID=252529 RepID=A0ABP0XU71_9ROSI